MSESKDLNKESSEQAFNPLLTFDPTTFEAWVIILQTDLDRLGLTKAELIIRMVKKYGVHINICIGQTLIFNNDDC